MRNITLYEWPDSQICMDCEHGEFILLDSAIGSEYICNINCQEYDGVNCPKFKEENNVLST